MWTMGRQGYLPCKFVSAEGGAAFTRNLVKMKLSLRTRRTLPGEAIFFYHKGLLRCKLHFSQGQFPSGECPEGHFVFFLQKKQVIIFTNKPLPSDQK
jgi:hypothetical protein